MNITTRIQLDNITLGDLIAQLDVVAGLVDDTARVNVRTIPGDRPWESASDSIEISGEGRS